MISFLPTFRLNILHLEIALVIHHASVWSNLARVDVEINYGADGTHSANTLHAWDLALDLDTVGDKASDTAQLAGYLARVLPAGYDVLNEGDHVHVEWDPKRQPPALSPMHNRAGKPAPPTTTPA